MTDLQSFLQIDLPAILAAVLACFSWDLVSFPGGEGVDGCVKLPWRLFFRALW
jgi:hypothetical protein